MQEKDIKKLFHRCKAGLCTEEEELLIEAWLSELRRAPIENTVEEEEADLREVWERLESREIEPREIEPRRKAGWKVWLRVAALLLLGAGINAGQRWYQSVSEQRQLAEDRQMIEIPPASPGATLTLGDGSVVALQKLDVGEQVSEHGSLIKKQAQGELVYDLQESVAGAGKQVHNTITTPRGEQFKVILPDGTRVWLNAASSLRFPTAFSKEDRIVELQGEAYFEVETNASGGELQPFIVRSQSQEVEVLGTHFNINDYENEPGTETTLLEGSVRVTRLKAGKPAGSPKLLLPGQQSIVRGDEMEIQEAEPQDAIAWKNGYFRFDHADLKEVMRQLERWYDIEVEYNTERRGDAFVGEIPRNAELSKALRILQLGGVEFQRKGRTVIITN